MVQHKCDRVETCMSCGLALVGVGLAVARCTFQVQTNNAPFGNNPNAGHYKRHCASVEEGDHIWALMYVLRPRNFMGWTQYNGLLHSKVIQLRRWGDVRSPTLTCPCVWLYVWEPCLSVDLPVCPHLSLSYLSLALSWCVAKIGLYSREVSHHAALANVLTVESYPQHLLALRLCGDCVATATRMHYPDAALQGTGGDVTLDTWNDIPLDGILATMPIRTWVCYVVCVYVFLCEHGICLHMRVKQRKITVLGFTEYFIFQ
jgi:hypothetical protein